MHCCECITAALPDLIDCGLDAWQTVQAHLPGQFADLLKRDYGLYLAFVGATDTTNTLGLGTPGQPRTHVRHQILALGQHGGYTFAPDHTIMEEVPPENAASPYSSIAAFHQRGYTL
jgi:uroporphyrinogen decarboxylase